jgi:hypothetical protein
MQELKLWQKAGLTRALALGTAFSIVLQMTSCYAIANANPLNTDEQSNNTVIASVDPASTDVSQPALRVPQATGNLNDTGAKDNDGVALAAASAPVTTTTTTTTASTATPVSGNTSISYPSPLLNGQVVTETNDPVERNTRDVILKIFEFERLNTYFRIESTKQSKWRKWRTLIAEEAAAIGVAAGTLIAIEQTGRALHTGYKLHAITFKGQTQLQVYLRLPGKIVLEHAFITALPGVWFAVGQQLFELGQNYVSDWKIRQKGFDPKTTRIKAKQLQDQIDGMLSERSRLISASGVSQPEKDIEMGEQKVLQDLRDTVVQEYINYYVGARRQRCFQNMFYMADLAEKITGVLSLQAGLEGTRRQEIAGRLKGQQNFGVLQLCSAALVELTPFMAKYYSNWRGHISKKFIDKYMTNSPSINAEALDADRKHLQDLYLNAGSARGQSLLNNLMARDAIYKTEGETFYALQAMRNRETRETNKAFWNNLKVRTVACAAKTTYGISGILLGDGRQTNPRNIMELILMGTIPYEAALDLSVYDKAHTTFKIDKKEKNLRAKNELPGQIYKARLERLDQAQNVIAPGTARTP